MTKILTAHIEEPEDAESVVPEVRKLLGLPGTRLKNAAAIISCYSELHEDGIIKAAADALECRSLGCSSAFSATDGGESGGGISIAMITSDTAEFEIKSGDFAEENDYAAGVTRLVREFAESDTPPDLLYFAGTPTKGVTGDLVVRAADAAGGNIPLFGGFASSHKPGGVVDCRTYIDGESSEFGYAFLGMRGVKPGFAVAITPDKRLIRRKAEITKAEGSVIYEINGMSAVRYMERAGFNPCLPAIVFLLTLPEGVTVARSAYPISAADSAIFCTGEVTRGSQLSFAMSEETGVLASARHALETFDMKPSSAGVLVSSCISRSWALIDKYAETSVAREMCALRGVPLFMSAAGGEFCPVRRADGTLKNEYHNFTFTMCVLQ